jgi:hypothetical protein
MTYYMASQAAPCNGRASSTVEMMHGRKEMVRMHACVCRHIVVEDVRVKNPNANSADDHLWLRRMVFTANRNLTQSEAYLIPASHEGPAVNGGQVHGFAFFSLVLDPLTGIAGAWRCQQVSQDASHTATFS